MVNEDNEFSEDDREVDSSNRIWPNSLDQIIVSELGTLSIGDTVSMETVAGEIVHGFVDHKTGKRLQILQFLAEKGSAQGPDANIGIWHIDQIKRLAKENDYQKWITPIRAMDLKFYQDSVVPGFRSQYRYSSETKAFHATKTIDKMTNRQILYDTSLWQTIKFKKIHSLNLLEFSDDNGVQHFINPRSWRLQDNFAFMVKVNDPAAIQIYDDFKQQKHLIVIEKHLPKSHRCNPECINGFVQRARANETRNFEDNLFLTVPQKFGFKRDVTQVVNKKEDKYEHQISYIAPCGKTILTEEDLEVYFIATKMSPFDLTYVNFNFEKKNVTMCQMSPPDKGEDPERCTCDDITMGRENIKIPVYSGKGIRPPKLIYPRTNYWVPKYIPDEEYKEFRVCCTCTDGCQSGSCECMQLTFDGYKKTAAFYNRCVKIRKMLANKEITAQEFEEKCNEESRTVGYTRGKLKADRGTSVETTMSTGGTFECHSGCACRQGFCNNRVVQLGMKVPLIIFRTSFCGWGVRSATSIPAGTYLCDYFGELMYENSAMEQSELNLYESDTVATLNHIEIAESAKREPNRNQIVDSNLADFEKDFRDNYDEGYFSRYSVTRSLLFKHHGSAMPPNHPKASNMTADQLETVIPIYDASSVGNLGRFFNHSCNPNIGIQNIFIEHLDPRFPRVSFFTKRNVKAGEELCWNYGYMTNQNVKCHCGASNCRGYFK